MDIKIKELTKIYGKETTALNDVDLHISQGMFGLLGKNGAGKTTLMRILTALLEPTRGSVEICGIPLKKKNILSIKSLLGYLPQEFGFYNNLTVYEAMNYMGMLNKMKPKKRKERIEEVLIQLNLQQQSHKRFRQLSGGMKKRLGIAQALLNEPKILIVDEPTSGVDPEERVRIRNILSEYSKNNIVLLSTHIVEDIASTCEMLAVLDYGKVIYKGSVEDLIQQAKGSAWKCTLYNTTELDELKQNYTVISSQHLQGKIEARIVSKDQPSLDCIEVEPSIEDAYMLLSSKEEAK